MSLATPLTHRQTTRFGILGIPTPESRRRRLLIEVSALTVVGISVLYLAWRAAVTLNPTWWPLAIVLLGLETHQVAGLALFTHALWRIDERPAVAERTRSSKQRIALVVPTLNESAAVLFPVLVGARACRLVSEVWVLDDGNRPEIRSLAEDMGVYYLARPHHDHAKAGNLNFWLDAEGGRFDLMAVVDADHVPAPSFLEGTVAYFDDPAVALVQTPQEFYNPSFEYNDPDEFSEQKLFYRLLEPGKNRVNAAFWCGTSAVLRIAALRTVGGVDVLTVTEDIATSIRLHGAGWRTVFHNEVLAVGLAAPDAGTYAIQRIRWGIGAMQVLRRINPWRMNGLSLNQRIAYTTTLVGWFDAWRSAGYLTIPLIVVVLGANPIGISLSLFLPIWAVVSILQQLAMYLLSRGLYRPGLSLLFDVARLEAGIRATTTLVRGIRPRFVVTAKSGDLSTPTRAPRPTLLIGYLIAGGIGLAWFVATASGMTPLHYLEPGAAIFGAVWLALNLGLVGATVRRITAARFAPMRESATSFAFDSEGWLDGQPVRFVDLSIVGTRIEMTGEPPTATRLDLYGAGGAPFSIAVGEVHRRVIGGGRTALDLVFTDGQVAARAAVAELLFCGRRGIAAGSRRDHENVAAYENAPGERAAPPAYENVLARLVSPPDHGCPIDHESVRAELSVTSVRGCPVANADR